MPQAQSNFAKIERNFKNYQWWINKKSRIDQTITDFNSNSPTLIARAKAQTKVKFSLLTNTNRIGF